MQESNVSQMSRQGIKTAAGDVEFESRLNTLVFPQIRSKLPRLLPLMTGFELLDVDDDETEATGIYAFRVGDQMVYVPIFFKDGHVKGLNLLYLENDDLFLPAEDEWVNYVINRQPFTLGKLVGREELQSDTLSTFNNVADAFGKTGSKTKFGTAGMAANITRGLRNLKSESRCDLGSLLLRFPKSATLQVLNTMQENDEFGRAVLQFYPYSKLAVIANKVMKAEPIKEPSANPRKGKGIPHDKRPLALTSDDEGGLGGVDLTSSEKDDIQLEGVAIRDNRSEEDVTKVFRTSAPAEWFNPTCGIFKILDIKGKQRKAVVFEDIITVGEGTAKCKVIATKDGKGGTIGRKSLTATEELGDEEWSRWFETLPKIGDATLATKDKFLLVTSKLQSTPTLTVVGPRTRGTDGISTLYVSQETCVEKPYRSADYGYGPYPCNPAARSFGGLSDDDDIRMDHEEERTPYLESYTQREVDKGERDIKDLDKWDYRSGRRLMILASSDNDDLVASGNQLIVGTDARVLKIDDEPRELMSPCDTSLWPHIKQAAGVRHLRVYSDGHEFEIKCGTMNSGMVSRPRAIIHLVCGHGLNIKAARIVLKDALTAAAKNKTGAAFAIKHAAAFPELDIETGSYGDQQGISESEQSVQMEEGAGNPFLTSDINNVSRAARTGQKSVFDSSILTALVRRHDVSTVIDEMLGDLTIGLDRICRILFLLYAHRDAFEEQFSQEDVPQLEDTLENLSKELGEALLFLKKKSIETEAGVSEPEGLLSPVA